MTSYWKSYHRRVIRMLCSLTCKSVSMPFQSKFLYFLAFNYQYIIKEVKRKILPTLYVFPIYSTFLRLEFGSAAQPPPTPSAAEKPVTPTGERRKFYYVIVIGLCGEQFREWSGEWSQIGRGRSARVILKHDYRCFVLHSVRLPINCVVNKVRGTQEWKS